MHTAKQPVQAARPRYNINPFSKRKKLKDLIVPSDITSYCLLQFHAHFLGGLPNLLFLLGLYAIMCFVIL
jgi:hypothetical protein